MNAHENAKNKYEPATSLHQTHKKIEAPMLKNVINS
jgi:hypothetical protein